MEETGMRQGMGWFEKTGADPERQEAAASLIAGLLSGETDRCISFRRTVRRVDGGCPDRMARWLIK
jgi:hypothetical protein